MTIPKQTQQTEPAEGFLKTSIGVILSLVRPRPIGWASAVGGLAMTLAAALGMLAAMLALSQPAHAQQASQCATGGAVTDPANNPGLVSDCEALLAARDTLAGTATLDWAPDTPIAGWERVTVTGAPLRVTRLDLLAKGLTGEIPVELGSLSNLQVLNLGFNDLTGEIPAELGRLTNLAALYLIRNQLTGEIPAELGSLSNLEELELHGNDLTGEIPAELGSLSNLKRLFLQGNQLTGEIPGSLTGLALRFFYFYNNAGLCAPIDEAFQTWLQSISNVIGSSCAPVDSPEDRAVLAELYRATGGESWSTKTNWLSDRPVREWHGVTNDASGRVNRLLLGSNGLTGEIPDDLDSLSNLTQLSLFGNQLTGEIPEELGNLSNLKDLHLYRNQLTGEIPAELGSLSNLTELWLGGNELSGEIPAWLGTLSNLTRLSLWGNQLTGEIPAELGSLANLTQLTLGDNQLTGEIPAELGSLINLTSLNLSFNQLTGEIPAELGSLSNLIWLSLNDNDLEGDIPTSLGNLSNLISLSLSNNRLTGCVPPRLRDVPVNDIGRLGLPFCPVSPPEAPTIESVTPETESLTISWSPPLGDGGSDITAYDLRYIETDEDETDDSNWTVVEDVWTTGGDLEYTLAGLTVDTQYDLQVRAINDAGDGPWSETFTGTPTGTEASVCVTGGAVTDATNTGLVSDCEVLLTARDTLAVSATLNWVADTPIAEWEGVNVRGTPLRVTGLNLRGWGLTGEISAELGSLSNLKWLDLDDNQLTGEIPAELGSLSNLTQLQLSSNRLTGEIPAELGSLANLTWLYLYDNQLTGEIPAELGSLSNLTGLYLYDNQLTGEIPTELGSLANLQSLHLDDNQLSGEIPTELGSLANLQSLSLWNNQLSGEIPAELGSLSNLQSLHLDDNQLSGEIPAELGSLSNLQRLHLDYNQLTGEIPAELGSLSNLTRLFFDNNQLTGELPQSFTGLTSLETLQFSMNTGLCAPANEAFQTWLQGVSTVVGDNCVAESTEDRAVLVELYNATDGANWTDNTNWPSDEPLSEWNGVTTDDEGRVVELSLSRNGLSGEIPAELGSLDKLEELSLERNQLSGEIPAELSSLANLTRLFLDNNRLTGEIPAELGSLSKLEELTLWSNQLTGEIPAELGSLSNLTRLFLGNNQLAGEIPAWLGTLSNLQGLALWSNRLTGEIPAELGNLSNLRSLSLQNNRLTGEIPAELGDLSNLTLLYLNDNELEGSIPASLGRLSNLERLRLSNNRLTGCVPPRLRDVRINDFGPLGLPFCPVSPPEAPTIESVASETESLTISWSPPPGDGGSDITAYDLHHIETDEDETADSNWTVVEDVWTTGGGDLQYTLTGLTGGTQYDLQVRAVNEAGDGSWSDTVIGTPTAPSACVTGGAVSDATNTGLVSDCEALLAGRDTLAGSATLNWSANTPMSRWDGVSLGGTPRRVTRLNLAGQGLSGMIPPELGRLSMLTHLNLRSNDGLTGEIPDALGNLGNLRVLNLHSNSHTGAVPDLRNATLLEELYLANNADYNDDGSKVQGSGLTGGIPTWLNGMTNMRELWLWGNSLSGAVPDLSGMTGLDKLKLANNNLTGGVPEASMLPPNMTWLIIDRNPFGGTIPDLSSLSRLRLLWLHSNELTGSVPAGNNYPASLDDLNLRDNMLTGTIRDLSNLDNLTRLRLHNNSLSGEIPATLGGLDSLKYLWLHNEDATKTSNGNNAFTSIAAGVGDLADTLIVIALSGNPWDANACVPVELANVATNDYAEAGIAVCSSN